MSPFDTLVENAMLRIVNRLLAPIDGWLASLDINSPQVAEAIVRLIPAQCPFERDISLWGHHLFHIPPMCKLNPLYDRFVELRFRALCYLVDTCGSDISAFS